jgi:type II secretory ATPase GspE/PulE/Tfp pilus assembly ATPase PilB-like protein
MIKQLRDIVGRLVPVNSEPVEKARANVSGLVNRTPRHINQAVPSVLKNRKNVELGSYDEVVSQTDDRVEQLNILPGTVGSNVVVVMGKIPSHAVVVIRERTVTAVTLKSFEATYANNGISDVQIAYLNQDDWEKLVRRITRDRVETNGSVSDKNEALQLWSSIVDWAISHGASDIHILCDNHYGSSVRYRIDGALVERPKITDGGFNKLLGCVRAAWNSKNNQNTGSQKEFSTTVNLQTIIRHSYNSAAFDLRFHQTPHGDQSGAGDGGFHAVMRITSPASGDSVLYLDDYGYSSYTVNEITKNVRLFNGLMLVSGSTGSGKSTACLSIVLKASTLKPRKSIQTIEDPVESVLGGNISQMSIQRSGDSEVSPYVAAISQKLRQDPDMIYMGEIQGSEMAALTVQAAVTGHFTIATIHSTDAVTIPTNFTNKGADFHQLLGRSCLKLAISQKLIRRLCQSCCKPFDRDTDKILYDTIAKLISVSRIQKVRVANRDSDCSVCGGIGFKGRIPCEEAMPITEDIRLALLDGDSNRAIENWYSYEPNIVLADGYHGRLMSDRAIYLVGEGVIDPSELEEILADVENFECPNPISRNLNGSQRFEYIWGERIRSTIKKTLHLESAVNER